MEQSALDGQNDFWFLARLRPRNKAFKICSSSRPWFLVGSLGMAQTVEVLFVFCGFGTLGVWVRDGVSSTFCGHGLDSEGESTFVGYGLDCGGPFHVLWVGLDCCGPFHVLWVWTVGVAWAIAVLSRLLGPFYALGTAWTVVAPSTFTLFGFQLRLWKSLPCSLLDWCGAACECYLPRFSCVWL